MGSQGAGLYAREKTQARRVDETKKRRKERECMPRKCPTSRSRRADDGKAKKKKGRGIASSQHERWGRRLGCASTDKLLCSVT